MANLRLLRSECRNDFLPPFCMVCGEATSDLEPVRRKFIWQPVWIILFVFCGVPGLLMVLILSSIMRKSRTVDVPHCEDHRNYFKIRLWINIGLGVAFLGTIGTCIALAQINAPPGTYVAAGLVFLALLIAAAVISQRSVRPTMIDDRIIKLTNVSQRFRDEVKRLQEEDDEEFERFQDWRRKNRGSREDYDQRDQSED